jgi:Zn-dependent protease with chaperone function
MTEQQIEHYQEVADDAYDTGNLTELQKLVEDPTLWEDDDKISYAAHYWPIVPSAPKAVMDAVTDVSGKARLPMPQVFTDLRRSEQMVASTVFHGKDTVLTGYGADEYFTPTALRGILAHEMGHLVLKHPQEKLSVNWADNPTTSRMMEYEADAYAASIGYGPQLIEALQTRFDEVEADPETKGLGSKDSPTHPALSKRIKRLHELEAAVPQAA